MPYLAVNGKSLFYTYTEHENASSNSERTILLLHGLGSSSCFYQAITSQLRSVSRCIALDTSGSGLSQLGSSAQQSIVSIAADAIGVLDALNVKDKAFIVGHSMGGIVASYLAAEFPNRICGVVLLGPVHPSPPVSTAFEDRIRLIQKDGLETLANTVPMSATGKKSNDLHHAFIRALILGTSMDGYLSLCRVIASANPPNYENITVPLLIIAGEDDQTAPIRGSQGILEEYGMKKEDKKIEILDGVGHWYCIEAPTRVASLIVNFIKDKF